MKINSVNISLIFLFPDYHQLQVWKIITEIDTSATCTISKQLILPSLIFEGNLRV